MTEQYISGYIDAISRVKDIITKYLGGNNSFFSIGKNPLLDVASNIRVYIKSCEWFWENKKINPEVEFADVKVEKIENWEEKFSSIISNWTCDSTLTAINGKNGFLLSEYLVKFLLRDFFTGQDVNVYKLLDDNKDLPWNDHMNEDFVFETSDKIYIMHFGEST